MKYQFVQLRAKNSFISRKTWFINSGYYEGDLTEENTHETENCVGTEWFLLERWTVLFNPLESKESEKWRNNNEEY